jgi:hypothetical protein
MGVNATMTPETETTTVHPWERAGLGKAPFRWLGVRHLVGPIRIAQSDGTTLEIGAPGQPMGSCAYCAQGIAECHSIKSADGKVFMVGCDCVRRVSEPGDPVLKAAESAAKKRRNAAARARNAAKATASASRIAELLADENVRARLAAYIEPGIASYGIAGKSFLAHAEWLASRCGNAGRLRLIARIEAALSKG